MRKAFTIIGFALAAVIWMYIFMLVGYVVDNYREPTITLTSKEWECVAWRATSVASAETECTSYWRVN